METIVFLLLFGIAVCFVVPVVAITKANRARRSVEEFEARLRSLEAELQLLRHAPGEPETERPFAAEKRTAEGEPFVSLPIVESPEVRPASVPPPLPKEVLAAAASRPPPAPPQPPSAELPVPQPSLPAINWEQFMGAKLFA